MRRAIHAFMGLPMGVTKPLTTDSQTHGQGLAAVFTAFLPTVGGHCSPRSSCHREGKRLLITGTFAASTGRQAIAASVNCTQTQNRCRLGVVADFRSDYLADSGLIPDPPPLSADKGVRRQRCPRCGRFHIGFAMVELVRQW